MKVSEKSAFRQKNALLEPHTFELVLVAAPLQKIIRANCMVCRIFRRFPFVWVSRLTHMIVLLTGQDTGDCLLAQKTLLVWKIQHRSLLLLLLVLKCEFSVQFLPPNTAWRVAAFFCWFRCPRRVGSKTKHHVVPATVMQKASSGTSPSKSVLCLSLPHPALSFFPLPSVCPSFVSVSVSLLSPPIFEVNYQLTSGFIHIIQRTFLSAECTVFSNCFCAATWFGILEATMGEQDTQTHMQMERQTRKRTEERKRHMSPSAHVSSIRARYLVHTSRLLFIFFRFFFIERKRIVCIYISNQFQLTMLNKIIQFIILLSFLQSLSFFFTS